MSKIYTQEEVDAAINAEREKVQAYLQRWRDRYTKGTPERASADILCDDLNNFLCDQWADEAGE